MNWHAGQTQSLEAAIKPFQAINDNQTQRSLPGANGSAGHIMENFEMDNIDFKAGDAVVLIDTGEQAIIVATHRDVAWIFADRDGFDTADFSELRRPVPYQEISL